VIGFPPQHIEPIRHLYASTRPNVNPETGFNEKWAQRELRIAESSSCAESLAAFSRLKELARIHDDVPHSQRRVMCGVVHGSQRRRMSRRRGSRHPLLALAANILFNATLTLIRHFQREGPCGICIPDTYSARSFSFEVSNQFNVRQTTFRVVYSRPFQPASRFAQFFFDPAISGYAATAELAHRLYAAVGLQDHVFVGVAVRCSPDARATEAQQSWHFTGTNGTRVGHAFYAQTDDELMDRFGIQRFTTSWIIPQSSGFSARTTWSSR
jgi:hypothetical protein